MNEDDTFKELQRAPFSQMCDTYLGFTSTGFKTIAEREKFLNQYGWDWNEFVEYFNMGPNDRR